MCHAAFQPGSSAKDFSITPCNCSRSAALTRLKRYCLGVVIADNSFPANSQTKLTHPVFFMVRCMRLGNRRTLERRQDPGTRLHRLDRLQRRLEEMIHLPMFGHPSAENWFEVQ